MNLDTVGHLAALRRSGNPAVVGGNVDSAVVVGGVVWRCVLVRALGVEEEQGTHNVYVDLIDFNGNRVEATDSLTLRYGRQGSSRVALRHGWDGMEGEPILVPFEKNAPEPLGNVPLFRGQRLWVQVADVHYPSDRVVGFGSGVGGHESFYVVFQLAARAAEKEKPGYITVPRRRASELLGQLDQMREEVASWLK